MSITERVVAEDAQTRTVEVSQDGHVLHWRTERKSVPVSEVNEQAIRAKAKQALTANATFLAIGSPSAAQVAAQVKSLTRQVQALIRLTLVELETDDT